MGILKWREPVFSISLWNGWIPRARSTWVPVPYIVPVSDTLSDWYHEQAYVTKQCYNVETGGWARRSLGLAQYSSGLSGAGSCRAKSGPSIYEIIQYPTRLDAYKLASSLRDILAISTVYDEKFTPNPPDTTVYPPYTGWALQFLNKMDAVRKHSQRKVTVIVGHPGMGKTYYGESSQGGVSDQGIFLLLPRESMIWRWNVH